MRGLLAARTTCPFMTTCVQDHCELWDSVYECCSFAATPIVLREINCSLGGMEKGLCIEPIKK